MKIDYPYVPPDRIYKYASAENEFMVEAKRVTLSNSTDSIQPTGAVIVKNGKILAFAANRSAIINPFLFKLHAKYCIRKMLHIKTGTGYWACPGCASSKYHSEPRALADAKNKGMDVRGADLYHWGHWWCCKPCWDAMISSGIKDVYLLEGSEHFFRRGDPQSLLGKLELKSSK